MNVNVISLLITLLASSIFALAALFIMMVALNGYSGSDANFAFIAYAALALAVILITSGLASFSTGGLVRRGYKVWFAVPIASIGFSFLAFVFIVIAAFLGGAVAEIVRVNF